MTRRVTLYNKTIPKTPSIEAFRGRRLAKSKDFANLCAAQDTAFAGCYRVVGDAGMEGRHGTWVSQGDPTSSADTHPTDNPYEVAQWEGRLAPGHFLECWILALPSGKTQNSGVATDAGTQGSVEIDVEFRGDSTESDTWSVDLSPSPLEHGALPTDNWAPTLDDYQIVQIFPPDALNDDGALEDFSQGVEYTLDINFRGGARPVDCVVLEKPLAHVQGNDPTEPPVHAADIGGQHPKHWPTPGPQTDADDWDGQTESRFGTTQLLEVMEAQGDQLGPVLVYWTAWDPDNFDPTVTTHPTWDITATTTLMVDLFDDSIDTWAATNPGWLVDGSMCQVRWLHDDSNLLGTGRAVIPVRIWATGDYTDNGGGGITLRFQSSETEWIEIEFTGGLQTLEATGYLEVPVVGDQPLRGNLQVFRQAGNALDEFEFHAFKIEYEPL